MDIIAEVLIDDVPTKVLLDTGATINLMPVSYAKAAGLEIKPPSLITDKHVTMSLAVGQYSEAVTYTEFNLRVPGVSDYNMDRLALLAENDSSYSRRVPVALGTKTLDSIMYAMKEGKIELLDKVWRQTKNQRSCAKLHELVGFLLVAITCPKKQGVEPSQFEDHTPYSNKGMEDLLDIDEAIHGINTVVIPLRSGIFKGQTSLVLFGTKMNVATEPLKRGDPPLPRGLHLRPSHARYNCGGQVHVTLYNMKDQPMVIQKGTRVGGMVAANIIPEKVLLPGTLEALD